MNSINPEIKEKRKSFDSTIEQEKEISSSMSFGDTETNFKVAKAIEDN